MVLVSIEEAQHRLAELLKSAADGEEVVISNNDIPLGRLLAIPIQAQAKPSRIFGQFAGLIKISDDFDAPLEDFEEYM